MNGKPSSVRARWSRNFAASIASLLSLTAWVLFASAALGETKDRLSAEAMRELVVGPMARVEAGDVAAAKVEFESLLSARRQKLGDKNVKVPDTLMAFGLGLYGENEELRPDGINYIRRSTFAYRAVFGPQHPEVTLALTSLADAEIETYPDSPPAEADAALQEALDIRKLTLPEGDVETVENILMLADLRGRPERVAGSEEKLEDVAKLIDEAVSISRDNARAEPQAIASAYTKLATVYAKNRHLADAMKAFALAMPEWRAHPDASFWQGVDLGHLQKALEQAGDKADAEIVEQQRPKLW